MANWFVGKIIDKFIIYPIIDKLINTYFEYLQDQPSMKDKLERLQDNHHKITAIVTVARREDNIDQDPALNKWIWQIRDAIDEADDLLDDFEYLKHKERLDRNKEEIKVRSYLNNISNIAKRLCVGNDDPLKSKPDLKKLEEVVHKIDIIFDGASPFLHLLQIIKQEQLIELHKTRETGSLPKNDLIDRGKDKDSIIEWLRKPSNEEPQIHATTTALYHNISLLSIVGHGGMGKTTLLQHVYEDEITEEFDLKMWVCVSDTFDAKKVIADMLESVLDNRSLSTLQKSLMSKVMSKKFLLVLDDIWDKDEEVVLSGKLGDVLAPLAYGDSGSKILITTRTDSVASMIAKVIRKKKEAWRLESLKEDECLQLLEIHAFADAENPDDHKKLRSIAGELVKKLYGSPLAAKVMGGVLNSSLNERHWRNVSNSNLGLDGIFHILKLSYIFLPQHLQSCFSFCSIFKQDHLFDKDDLVRMWIAVGFIQPSHIQRETLTLEDVGESYFDALIKKSFFDKVSTNEYKMHDLLHELAQTVSTHECFRFVGDEKSLFLQIPKTIRHLSIETSNSEVLKGVGRFKNLKTLHITDEYDSNLVDVLVEIFQVIKNIRLLHLNYSFELRMMPEEIGYLHHLRYLRFSSFNVKLLPRSLSSLYHLQFIIFDDLGLNNFSNNYFPRDMNNLLNLRYLSYSELNFPGIGKLKFLQKLNKFNIKNENGYRIEELEHMNDLRILGIINLENLRDDEEACNAKICDKRRLKHLSLDWTNAERDIADCDLDERVLDNLQPHNYLMTLGIYSYVGVRSAKWMNEAHLINNLQEIILLNCLEWEILPPFGQLPFLKTLRLSEMLKAKRLENKFHGNDMLCVFPSLQTLHIIGMEALVDWFDASVVDDLFPCLIDLELVNCPNLQELPYLPPKLELLNIRNIEWKTLNCCSISNSIPLKTLEVMNCQNIASISLEGEIGKLEKLIIKDLPSLQSLPSSLINIISSLEFVEMKMLPQLQEYPDLPLPFIKMKIKKRKLHPEETMQFTIENDHRLVELEHMNEIRFLYIDKLKDVRDAEEACNAKLCDKRKLTYLSLRWGIEKCDIADSDLDERVLDNLQPHNYLKTLFINNFMGARSAIWMNEAYLINNLQDIHLFGCLEWEILPPFGQLPFLKTLYLRNMPKVKRVENKFHGNDMRCVFPSLEKLSFIDMEALVDWFDASVVDDLFPCLTELLLRKCPNLQKLSYLPAKLESLEIDNIEWKTLNFCTISKSIPLKTLQVRHCPNITSISPCVFLSLETLLFSNLKSLVDWFDASVVDGLFPCLTKLFLSNCTNLQELPYSPPKLKILAIDNIGWKTLNCCSFSESIPLETLQVHRCPSITSISLEGEIDKLEKLTIEDLQSLESFPSSLANISTLKFLKLAKLPQLQQCPVLPPSLKEFYLGNVI